MIEKAFSHYLLVVSSILLLVNYCWDVVLLCNYCWDVVSICQSAASGDGGVRGRGVVRGGEEVNRTIDICVHALSQTMTGHCYSDHKISPTNKMTNTAVRIKSRRWRLPFPLWSYSFWITNHFYSLFIVVLACFMRCIIIHYFEYPDGQCNGSIVDTVHVKYKWFDKWSV